jgi:dTDP-4-amino-4,6-dideoxygalactose transaminase
MRMMSLHGLSQDAWDRYSGGRSWDYRIVAPGFKYNLTDVAAALGIRQLERADPMRRERERIARRFREGLAEVEEVELPPDSPDRIHSWHLFPIRLRLERLDVDRNGFLDELKDEGVGCSVHWRPLHLHPYYQEAFGWRPEDLPRATAVWERLISLPIFPGMREEEAEHVIATVKRLAERHARPVSASARVVERG